MDIVTLGAAKSQTESYVESHFVAGSNIIIESNLDGTQTISASGEVSSEDTVARAAINAIKDGTTIDSFSDVESALATKVDKVSGKGLSTNDFTNTLKTKLDGIASGAEVNVQSDWNQTDNTADDYIKNKPTLGTAAAAATTDFATAAQGTKADSAIQSAGSGLSKSGTTLNHSNSVTAKTTQALRKISFDAQGHITGSSELSTSESNALSSGIDSTKVAQIAENEAALVDVVDSGAKNIFPVLFTSRVATESNPSCTNNGDGTITLNGARVGNDTIIVYDLSSDLTSSINTRYTLPAGKYNVYGGTDNVKVQVLCHDGTDTVVLANTYLNAYTFEYTADLKRDYPYIVWRLFIKGSSTFNNVKLYPMLCTKAAWDISQQYEPYALPNPELTAGTIELVDSGAKNRVPLSFASSSADFTVGYLNNKLIINGTSTSAQSVYSDIYLDIGTYMLTGCPAGGGQDTYQCELRTSTQGSLGIVDTGNGKQFTITTAGNYRYNVRIAANYTASNLEIPPMICTKAAWDISQAYVPYCPTLPEVNEQVEMKATIADIYGLGTPIESNADLDNYKTPGVSSISTATIAATVGHIPVQAAGRLEVKVLNANNRYLQIYYSNDDVYQRRWNGSVWNAWYKYTTESLT